MLQFLKVLLKLCILKSLLHILLKSTYLGPKISSSDKYTFSFQIPSSEIYEPAMVAPRRVRNRALTIANQQEARNEMEIATQRAQASTKIPTVFR